MSRATREWSHVDIVPQMSTPSSIGSCFAIMPIREPGSTDHAHFLGIYDQIRQVVEAEGFDIVRADEVTEEGSIAKDLITRLASATLVIADLTDLNPNVFWELGVRHALRASGTLLLLDETRTKEPPFDLSYLRLIKYRGTVEGLTELRAQLGQFVRSSLTSGDRVIGSPVHDWLTNLPPDLSVPASESEGALRTEVSEYKERLQRYARRYGALDDKDLIETYTPAERMRRAQRLAHGGRLPAQMMLALGQAAEQHDAAQFIDKMAEAIENRVDFEEREILRISGWATALDLSDVCEAVLAYGEDLHPGDDRISRARLTRLAESKSADDRALAQDGLAKLLCVDLDSKEILRDANGALRLLDKSDLELLGYLTSSMHADGRSEDALAVCQAFASAYPNRAPVLRMLGRAQEWRGDLVTGTESMQQALRQLDVDDTTAIWLGNSFHNCGRHVDAIEVYLISCWIDPDDASWFAYCANELSFALCEPFSLYDAHSPLVQGEPARSLPPEVTIETVAAFVTFALSTLSQTGEDTSRIEDSLRRTELSGEIPELQLRAQSITRADRRRGISELYALVRSDLTNGCPERVRPM